MKKAVFLFLFYFACCTTRKVINSNNSAIKDSIIAYELEKTLLVDQNNSVLENILNKYADSINTASTVNLLPKFLQEKDFDYNNIGLTLNTNKIEQFRSRIMNKVTSCAALRLIIIDTSGIFKERVSKAKYNSEYSDSTNFELARSRMDFLKCD